MDTSASTLAPVPAVQAIPPALDLQFRLFADSMSNLAWIARADGWIYWYNLRWYEYTGTSPAQMEGWGWQSVHDPAALPAVMQKWQASIATGEPFEMVFPLKGADGQFRDFLTRGVPLKDEAGAVQQWFGTNTDISREIAAAAALRESEQRFRTATEAVSAILWTNDAAGQMRGEQPAWGGFTGQTLAQYQGYGWADAIHPDDRRPTLEAWEEAVREDRLFCFEHRVRRHDGDYRLCRVRALPSRVVDAPVREWVGVHTDITEERRTQQALQETVAALKQQQELVEAAQLASKVGFWRVHPSTRKAFFSSGTRHLLGLPATGELSLDDALTRIHPEDLGPMRDAFQLAETTGRYHLEFRTTPTPGTDARWILGEARLIGTDPAGRYFVGMNLDITQQKLTSDALMRTEKLAVAGRLAASIAHEINNPLEAMTNLLYLLTESPLDPEQRHWAVTMRGELERVSHIATHTLRFHRQSTRAAQAALSDLVESVLALHEGRIRNASVDARRRLLATRSVFGFDGELRQVLANLVGNAIDALTGIPGPRLLLLRTHDATHPRSGEKGVSVTIADTGTGMSPETLGRLFEAFFTTKPDTGTGLGLWVSMEIVNKHKGTLRVRSSRDPRHPGTVFRLFLPLHQKSTAAPEGVVPEQVVPEEVVPEQVVRRFPVL